MPLISRKAPREDELKKRLYIFSAVPVVFFAVFTTVLFSLQIVQGPDYEMRAKTNREQFSIVPALRGVIYDDEKESIVAHNRRSFAVTIVPQNLPEDHDEREQLIKRLAILLEMPEEEIVEIVNQNTRSAFDSQVLRTDIPFEKIVFLAEHNRDFPGVYWKSKPVRIYPQRDLLSHIVGYVGMISEKELLAKKEKGYNMESVVGKSGVEKVYDLELKGRDGYVRRIVDATNQVTAEIIDRGAEPVPGNNVTLTVDCHIQEVAEKALGERIGAVVVSRPSTGEILALVSYPRYDPNLFSSQKNKTAFKSLILDKRKPFLNRAIQAQYPAGSIFKIVVALAVLDTEAVPPTKEFVCGGGYQLGNRFFACWSNHGRVDLYHAIVHSCDSYFYQAALALGPDVIAEYARMMGFGESTKIDLIGELTGTVPNPDWKRENVEDIWYDGDTLNMAIGQGYILVTLLQLNCFTNIIANGGTIYQPYIVSEIRSAKSDEVIYKRNPEILVKSDIDKAHYDFIASAMRDVVVKGTARWGGAVMSTNPAGKTSSAETAGAEETHSLYTAFAPYDAADDGEMISVTAIVEHGGAGSVAAAPLVSEILKSFFGHCNQETARRNIWKKRAEIYRSRKATADMITD